VDVILNQEWGIGPGFIAMWCRQRLGMCFKYVLGA
jgi:hypothetical protein